MVKRIKDAGKQDATGRIKAHAVSGASILGERPKFSFAYLDKDYCLSKCTKDEKAALADKLHQLSQLSWLDINNAARHGQGYEKINRTSIKGRIPPSLTEDVNILAFRFFGKAPMVGYRVAEVFYIVWLDRQFVLYDHG